MKESGLTLETLETMIKSLPPAPKYFKVKDLIEELRKSDPDDAVVACSGSIYILRTSGWADLAIRPLIKESP